MNLILLIRLYITINNSNHNKKKNDKNQIKNKEQNLKKFKKIYFPILIKIVLIRINSINK